MAKIDIVLHSSPLLAWMSYDYVTVRRAAIERVRTDGIGKRVDAVWWNHDKLVETVGRMPGDCETVGDTTYVHLYPHDAYASDWINGPPIHEYSFPLPAHHHHHHHQRRGKPRR